MKYKDGCQGSRQASVLNKVIKEDLTTLVTEEKATFEQGPEEGRVRSHGHQERPV